MEKWVVAKVVGKWDQRKDVENDEKDDRMCEKCCDAGRGISKYVDILQGVAQGFTLSPNLFKVFINDMILIVAVEAAKQGVTVGEDTMQGLMFADYFAGI